MTAHPVKLLCLCGSLRGSSSNRALLDAAVLLAPFGLDASIFEHLGALPPFNPDREHEVRDADGVTIARATSEDTARNVGGAMQAVIDLNERVREADALLIACPEYARGVPGAFKNALDWLVGGDAYITKPTVLFNASPRASHAQSSLRVILETMSGVMIDEACIELPLVERQLSAADIVADAALSVPIQRALDVIRDHVALHSIASA